METVRTTDEGREMDIAIDKLLKSLYEKEGSFDDTLNSINLRLAGEIREKLLKNKIDVKNKTGVEKFLREVREKIKESKILYITIAFEPTENTINRLFSWILKNAGDNILLDIQVDKNILGGALISFNGLYKDYSLNTAVSGIFRERKKEIEKCYEEL